MGPDPKPLPPELAEVAARVDDVLAGRVIVAEMRHADTDDIKGAVLQLSSGGLYLLIVDRRQRADATPLVEVRIPRDIAGLAHSLLSMALVKLGPESAPERRREDPTKPEGRAKRRR